MQHKSAPEGKGWLELSEARMSYRNGSLSILLWRGEGGFGLRSVWSCRGAKCVQREICLSCARIHFHYFTAQFSQLGVVCSDGQRII